jgi:NADH-quinone oxidoreductase subunit N
MGALMMGVSGGRDPRRGEGDKAAEGPSSDLNLLALGGLLTAALANGWLHGVTEIGTTGLVLIDGVRLFANWVFLAAATMAVLMSSTYVYRQRLQAGEFYALLLFATAGMMFMVGARDLIVLFLGLEVMSVSVYALTAFNRRDRRSAEAGLKYFLLGAFSTGFFLYGLALVYGAAGTTNISGVAAAVQNGAAPGVLLIPGVGLMTVGFAFKVSAVPFHMWTPDVYEGAPTPVTAFFAVAPKIAALGLFVRVMVGPFGDLVAQWQQIIVFISIASMALGAFAAINQRNIKRLMAYSSIGHIGYALVGLAPGTEAGVRGVLIYMAIYLFMNVGTFAVILCMRQKNRMVEDIADLAGMSRTHPVMAVALAVFMFSMAGIPPLAGFFGKLYVFLAAIESGLYVLAVIGLVTSVVSAYYYLRIVKIMFFDEPAEAFDRPIGWEMTAILWVTGAVTLLFFVVPGPILDSAAAAAAVLFPGTATSLLFPG